MHARFLGVGSGEDSGEFAGCHWPESHFGEAGLTLCSGRNQKPRLAPVRHCRGCAFQSLLSDHATGRTQWPVNRAFAPVHCAKRSVAWNSSSRRSVSSRFLATMPTLQPRPYLPEGQCDPDLGPARSAETALLREGDAGGNRLGRGFTLAGERRRRCNANMVRARSACTSATRTCITSAYRVPAAVAAREDAERVAARP